MIKAAIFDMDGLLIDSEPLWKESEIAVLRSVGVPLTKELCQETTGVRLDQAISHWYERFPWQGPTREQIERKVLAGVMGSIGAKGAAMPGAIAAVNMLRQEGFVLAIASSSPISLIHTVLEKLELSSAFSVVHSAECEAHGKPDPAVYLSTISKMGVTAQECIAFEDSVPGVQSAKAAGTFVIAVPAATELANQGFTVADMVLESLTEFSLNAVLARGQFGDVAQ